MTENRKATIKQKVRHLFVVGEAIAVRTPAEVFFECGGKEVLSNETKEVLREAIEKATAGGVGRLVGSTGKAVVETAGKQGVKEVAKTGVKESARQVFKGVGRAAGLGGLIDGAFGIGEGLHKLKKGQATGLEACVHAIKEAGTGAAASAVGVAATAGLVILTGPVSVPVATGVAIGASVGTKLGLNSLFA